jgi:hypothetical protein
MGRTHIRSRGVALEVRLDRLVLLVEVGEIRDEVLDHVGMRERVDLHVGIVVLRNAA